MIDGVKYLTSRLAWFIHYGVWPEHNIDHIDGVRDNDAITNLREATTAENNQNMGLRSDNTSGLRGVRWEAGRRRWRVEIGVGGKMKFIGRYYNKHVAEAAYARAKAKYHTFHPAVVAR